MDVVVIDNGTGYTKMGHANNPDPAFIIPTAIADKHDSSNAQISRLQQPTLDFHIGDEALLHEYDYHLHYPVRHGQVHDWQLMEKFWHRSIYQLLHCDPQEHVFILTETPMNPPENRESMAEIFFETFNAKGLYIGVQAVLAMISSTWTRAAGNGSEHSLELTGTVVDSGDGATQVIPIADGYVIGSCIKHIPLGGRDITNFYMNALRDRGEPIPAEEVFQVARDIKEKYGYLSSDGLLKELAKFDRKSDGEALSNSYRKYKYESKKAGKEITVDIGYERFLGAEALFHPEFVNQDLRDSVAGVVDQAIQGCPMDYRRRLYQNIVLSGGTTQFRNFDCRLQRELQERVSGRLARFSHLVEGTPEMEVQVSSNPYLQSSVWQGGNIVATRVTVFVEPRTTSRRCTTAGQPIRKKDPVSPDTMSFPSSADYIYIKVIIAQMEENRSPSEKKQSVNLDATPNANLNLTLSAEEAKAELEEGKADSEASVQKVESQVFSYDAPWLIYSLGFSSRPDTQYRLGLGSFLEEDDNQIQIIKLDDKATQFQQCISFGHKYPPTKLMFIPDIQGNYIDLMATSGESLQIYEIDDTNNSVVQKLNLKNQNEFQAPLTSFDWNPDNLNLLGTASIDTTCTIWDIEKNHVYTQLIAHDKEVYDISFSPNRNVFASVGADGSARQFDLRNLEHSTVLYETDHNLPLLKLGWNRLDSNYVAIIAMDQSSITILDTRQPLTPVNQLNNHKDCVNALSWAPQSSAHICTVGDDCQALIWDISDRKFETTEPLLEYRADQEISNLSWSLTQSEWLAICFYKTVQILKV